MGPLCVTLYRPCPRRREGQDACPGASGFWTPGADDRPEPHRGHRARADDRRPRTTGAVRGRRRRRVITPLADEIRPFAERYRQALADARLPRNLLAFQRAWRLTRDAAFDRLARESPSLGVGSTFAAAREKLVEAKNQVLRDPPAARK